MIDKKFEDRLVYLEDRVHYLESELTKLKSKQKEEPQVQNNIPNVLNTFCEDCTYYQASERCTYCEYYHQPTLPENIACSLFLEKNRGHI